MKFHLEERRAWVRTATHTVIQDRDPAFGRFCTDRSGIVARLIRVWQRGPSEEGRGSYLGSVCLGPEGFRQSDVRRLFDRLRSRARALNESPAPSRRQLRVLLQNLCEVGLHVECGESLES